MDSLEGNWVCRVEEREMFLASIAGWMVIQKEQRSMSMFGEVGTVRSAGGMFNGLLYTYGLKLGEKSV